MSDRSTYDAPITVIVPIIDHQRQNWIGFDLRGKAIYFYFCGY
jgi:hypothetical protein